MSEVIKEFIRRNPLLGERDAFEKFLEVDRIRTWVGDNPERRERIRREFTRVWGEEKGSGDVVQTVEVDVSAEDVSPRMPPPGSQRLSLMCPSCNQVDVWYKGTHIECRQCGSVYDDMLALIPVRPVGPFAYIFGEGVAGVATAAGIVLLLLLVYGVLRWV